ncbi:MAG: DUF420 domain-containing protein [Myxococcaceae bacterium]
MSTPASPLTQTRTSSDWPFYIFNALISAAALSFLAYILVIRRGEGGAAWDLRFMPAVNASLNALSATLLVAGYVAIRQGARKVHQYFMVGALTASTLFLVCYLVYHYVHGDTKFLGVGPLRTVYFTLLISHVLLSAIAFPLALSTVWFAARKRFATHRTISKVTFPLWLYVSVTGVLIFFFLRAYS